MIVASIVIFGTLLLVPAFSSEAPTPNLDELDIAYAPGQAIVSFVDACIDRLGPHCDDMGDMLKGNKKDVDLDCCTALVRMGKKCHYTLLKLLTEVEEESLEIHQRGVWIWNYCVRKVETPFVGP
ncbi:hypothetical protein FRX31_009971 [Thalictrum thalictroides]|uniref:Prolamin-like domain-containing protein n=1 Tax=Thalictrum thalictroides TaxID=46969 RepID=A0A7J6WTV0_THATH|nr:hypothetical protein FRX31_009971 [Thalictrum thalictroides]